MTQEEVAAWEGFAVALVGAPACSWPPSHFSPISRGPVVGRMWCRP
jgi:hypothetical protein